IADERTGNLCFPEPPQERLVVIGEVGTRSSERRAVANRPFTDNSPQIKVANRGRAGTGGLYLLVPGARNFTLTKYAVVVRVYIGGDISQGSVTVWREAGPVVKRLESIVDHLKNSTLLRCSIGYCLVTLSTSFPKNPAGLMIASLNCAYASVQESCLLVQGCDSNNDISLARVPAGKSLDNIIAPLYIAGVRVPQWIRLLLTTVIKAILESRSTVQVNNDLQSKLAGPSNSTA
ncbi:10674_t:CDS:2, partial [Acaulospora colombiana]